MAITAETVRDLREKTGAGMMECKKALTEAEGDMEKATQLLRERGQAVAAKREGKQASEGVIAAAVAPEGNRGVLVELNCETDFVARTDDFQDFAREVAQYAVAHPEATPESLTSDPDIQKRLNEKVAKLGERIVPKRIESIEGGGNSILAYYIHTGGKIGVMAEGEAGDGADREAAQSLLRDIAMHIAAAKPEYLSREDVPDEVLQREREIHETWARNQGKPEAAVPKIVQGRLDKLFYEASVLLDQPFIRDQDKTIQAVVKEHPANVTLKRFIRLRVGEG
jgi:elongation factor Ts